MNTEQGKKIILFDGICNLCNGAVTFIIERDTDDLFRYAALQSKVGKELAGSNNIDTSNPESMVLIDDGRCYTKSSAALKIARHLSGGYPLLYGLMALPPFIRDWVYDQLAQNRYRWFGKRKSCMVPTPELKAKFLNE